MIVENINYSYEELDTPDTSFVPKHVSRWLYVWRLSDKIARFFIPFVYFREQLNSIIKRSRILRALFFIRSCLSINEKNGKWYFPGLRRLFEKLLSGYIPCEYIKWINKLRRICLDNNYIWISFKLRLTNILLYSFISFLILAHAQ